MGKTIDARGFSCPQPVMMTLDEISAIDRGDIVVLVDAEAAKENVIRAAASQGWLMTDVQSENDEYIITISKK
ncbi:MAG: sulfurtransferase TusA family protein [Deltaproteobacteria bacterium]|nr:sulfurtransferase TusA family protein [Deltaproteobacteria bacterium]MBW1719007.1 sulfurtransferase TusA family protein [Deltaproteobacteria bacterium]MBW1932694.1 sulfurtransferase TusA family protein [Deltaproteobacteria bacterium]MBW1938843.1 sulfurtransferase TusA family protein [Deltaproteobacteria bacterium]MBW1964762.1 sulfurtransferase TusA family protein [Deltaproteobacteria bacterium]